MTTELTKAAQQALEALKETLVFCETFSNRWDGETGAHPFGMVERARAAVPMLTRALTQRPAAQAGEVDDGDVTGQPGPLPETGWDEVPAGAFRKPSPTAGMNLGQRIKHVGGRENAAGYIEFGSVAAVRALVRQYLRDLPTQPAAQATPEPVGEPVQLDVVRQAIEERDDLERRYHDLAHSMIYNGNSVAWWYSKAKAYRNAIDDVWSALRDAGIHPDGTKSCANGVRELAAMLTAAQAKGGDHAR